MKLFIIIIKVLLLSISTYAQSRSSLTPEINELVSLLIMKYPYIDIFHRIGFTEEYELLKKNGADVEIEILLKHPNDLIRTYAYNIQLQRGIANFSAKFSNEQILSIANKIALLNPIVSHYTDKEPKITLSVNNDQPKQIQAISTNQDLIALLDHPSAKIQFYAFQILVQRNEQQICIEMLPKIIKRAEYIYHHHGCVVRGAILGDFLINSFRHNQDRLTSKIIDSLLFFQDNHLENTDKILRKLQPSQKHYDRLKEMVFVKGKTAAYSPFFKFKNKKGHSVFFDEMEQLIINGIANEDSKNVNAIGIYFQWAHQKHKWFQIYPTLTAIHQHYMNAPNSEIYAKHQYLLKHFYSFVASDKSESAYTFLAAAKNKSILEPDNFDWVLKQHLHPKYNYWLFEHWSKTLKIDQETLKLLNQINPKKTLPLAQKTLENELNTTGKCEDCTISTLFLIFQKANPSAVIDYYLRALKSDNNCIKDRCFFKLKKDLNFTEPILNRMKIDHDFENLQNLYIGLGRYKVDAITNKQKAIEILKEKTGVLLNGKIMSDIDYQQKISMLN